MQLFPIFDRMKMHIVWLAGLLMACSGTDKVSFQWDLSTDAQHTYSMVQEGEVIMTDPMGAVQRSMIKATSTIRVSSIDSNNAFVQMYDLMFGVVRLDSLGNPGDTTKTNLPKLELQGMDARGQHSDPDGQIFFGLVLPLPSVDLAVGETDTLNITTPVNLGMGTLKAIGQKSMRFKGYETVDGKRLAVLESELQSIRLEKPEGVDGDFDYSEKASGTHWFDPETGRYVRSEVRVERSNEMILYGNQRTTIVNLFKYRLELVD